MNISSKPNVWWRPNISRWLSKEVLVTGESFVVPIVKFILLVTPPQCWIVMQWSLQDVGTKLIPVGLGVSQMLMPDLIDLVGWGHGMIGDNSKKNKLFIFVNNSLTILN